MTMMRRVWFSEDILLLPLARDSELDTVTDQRTTDTDFLGDVTQRCKDKKKESPFLAWKLVVKASVRPDCTAYFRGRHTIS